MTAVGLASRTALVTGASRGIGAEIARSLSASGARVALLARNADALNTLAAEIGGRSLPVRCDVTDAASVAAAAAVVRSEFGEAPHIIVNNAGFFRVSPLESMTPEEFVGSVETNLVAPFLVINAFLREMRERKDGHVVTIGSLGDRTIFPGNGAYSASKFGLRAMHEVLLAETRGTGVRATLISPSSVDTSLWDPIDTDGETTPFPARASMLRPKAIAEAVLYALAQPPTVNVDELRLSSS
ncbi:MAG: SDR family oxidoreductase [Gemmatimonadaceae bacterium]|nr:SDR family oxidoreductase [Gemmatimonadaceae bacterium]